MLSSGGNLTNGDDSGMPGDYQSWPPARPIVPPARTPFPRLPPTPAPTAGFPGRTPFPGLPPTAGPAARFPGRTPFPRIPPPGRRPPMVPRAHHGRLHRRRRRSLTPDIIFDRPRRHHSSWGGRRAITVAFDDRPTLGLRGSSRRCIEIERVRCHRRRRPRSEYYDYDYEYDDPPPARHPTIVANPIMIPSSSVVAQPSVIIPTMNNTAAAASAFLSHLTPEIINNLPRQTVHLPPIHLPGSQADATTELHTVIFPAEIINPIDGTLSIIQAQPTINPGIVTAPVQSQFVHIPPTTGVPVAPGRPPISPAMAADPAMQRFIDLFQRLSFPQTQPTPNPPVIRPTLPNISGLNPTNNTLNNTANVPGYPSANIRPSNPLNTGSYRPASVAPTIPGNLPAYRPSTFTPSASASASASATNPTYRPTSIAPSDSSDIGPYRPANITPYTTINNRSSNNLLTRPSTPTTYAATPSASSSTFTPLPRLNPSSSFGAGNNYLNSSSSFPSLAPTPNQSTNSMPKSILRNTTSTAPSNTIDTR